MPVQVVIHNESTDDDDGSDAGELENDQTMLSTRLRCEHPEQTPLVSRVAATLRTALFWRRGTARRKQPQGSDAWEDLCEAAEEPHQSPSSRTSTGREPVHTEPNGSTSQTDGAPGYGSVSVIADAIESAPAPTSSGGSEERAVIDGATGGAPTNNAVVDLDTMPDLLRDMSHPENATQHTAMPNCIRETII